MNNTGNYATFSVLLKHGIPAQLLIRAALTEINHACLVIFKFDKQNVDNITDVYSFNIFKLVCVNDSFRFVANINQDFIAFDTANFTLDN